MIETPILSEESLTASQASLGAAYLGADYGQIHFEAMTAAGRVSGDSVMDVADRLGVDLDTLLGIMDGDAINDTITRNYSAMQALDISGTPAFVVAGSPSGSNLESITMLPGAVPVEELRATIDRIRLGS